MYRLKYTSEVSEEEFHRRCDHRNWYHSYYFDNGFQVRGDYNIGLDIAEYGFAQDMSGMKVLDIGGGAGWFAHFFEQRGADVTVVDARGYCDFDLYGRYQYPPVESEKPQPDRFDNDGGPIYDSPVSGALWIMKEILGSRIRFRNARAYQICPDLFSGEMFDLVFLGSLLLHLRDPIGALMAARSVCRHEVVAVTPVVLGEPEGYTPHQYLPWTEEDSISWWLPNESCFRHWFLAAGFGNVDLTRTVMLHKDLEHWNHQGRLGNCDQTLRLGRAFV